MYRDLHGKTKINFKSLGKDLPGKNDTEDISVSKQAKIE